MNAQVAPYFISGMSAGAMTITEVVAILYFSGGYWRWGVTSLLAVYGALNLVESSVLMQFGALPITALFKVMVVNLEVMAVVLPVSALAAWGCGKFYTYVGGLKAK